MFLSVIIDRVLGYLSEAAEQETKGNTKTFPLEDLSDS